MTTEVSTQLSPKEAFEQKLTERLRQDIGELIPDEVLSEMVRKSIQDSFFTKRQKPNSYGGVSSSASWLDEAVAKLLKPEMDKLITGYFKTNEVELKNAILGALKDAVPVLIGEFFIAALSNTSHNIGWAVEQRFRDYFSKKPF